MLKQRVLTAVVLVAVAAAVVMLGLPPIATVWLLTVLVLIGAWEWAAFSARGSARSARCVHDRRRRRCWSRCLVSLRRRRRSSCASRCCVAVAWWIVAFLWVCLAPARVHPLVGGARRAARAGAVLAGAGATSRFDRRTSTHWVLFTLVLVWAADTGAFFAGRWFGRVPLAPRVSPEEDLGRRARRRGSPARWSPGSRRNCVSPSTCWPFVLDRASRSRRSRSSAISPRAC